MSHAPRTARPALVALLGFVALNLFVMNFLTFVSNQSESAESIRCDAVAHSGASAPWSYELEPDRLEVLVQRMERERLRLERKLEKKVRAMHRAERRMHALVHAKEGRAPSAARSRVLAGEAERVVMLR